MSEAYTKFEKITPVQFGGNNAAFHAALKERVQVAAKWLTDCLPTGLLISQRPYSGGIELNFRIAGTERTLWVEAKYDRTVPYVKERAGFHMTRGRQFTKAQAVGIMDEFVALCNQIAKTQAVREKSDAFEAQCRDEINDVKVPEGFELDPHLNIDTDGKVTLLGLTISCRGRTVPGMSRVTREQAEKFFDVVREIAS